eukprot:9838181-Lingulodinium_polyedra.AAC.1
MFRRARGGCVPQIASQSDWPCIDPRAGVRTTDDEPPPEPRDRSLTPDRLFVEYAESKGI